MNTIFLKLFNLSIGAGWLVLAVLCLRLVLKRAPKWVNCMLWALVGLRLVFPVSIESVFSLIPSAQTVPPEIVYEDIPEIHSGIPFINSSVNPILSETFAPSEAGASVNPLQVATEIASYIWLLGFALMLGYMAFGYIRLRVRLRTATRWESDVYQCEAVSSPFVLGILKPRIYLSYYMSEEDMPYVIAHEKAHLRRRDHMIKPIAFFLLAVYWFHPLMWVAYILLCRDVEYACDEKVLREFGGDIRREYSLSLLHYSVHRGMILACPLAFGEVGVKGRVKNVMNYKKPAFWILVVAVVAVIVTAVCFLTNPKTDENDQNETISLPGYFKAVELCGDIMSMSYQMDPEWVPLYYINEDMCLYEKQRVQSTGSGFEQWTLIGTLSKETLSKEEMRALFSDMFMFYGDIHSSSQQGITFEALYENNVYVLRCSERVDVDGKTYEVNAYTFFVQKDGSVYYGYNGQVFLYRMQVDEQLARQINVFSIHPMRSDIGVYLWGTKTLSEKNSYGTIGLELKFENQTGMRLRYQGEVRLSKKIGGKWKLIDYEDTAWFEENSGGMLTKTFRFNHEVLGEGVYSMSLFCDIIGGDEDLEGIPMAEIVFEIVDPGETTAEGYSYMGNEDEMFAPTFTLYGRNQATVTFGMLSGYIFIGTYEIEGDILTLTETGGYGLQYVFRRRNLEYVYDKEKSSDFLYVDVPDGAVFVRNFGIGNVSAVKNLK